MKFKFIFSSFTIDSELTMGGIAYTQTVNAETDMYYGCASMADVSFSFNNSLANSPTVTEGQTFELQISQTDSYVSYGTFTVREVKKAKSKTTVKAYDNMTKLDVLVDTWLTGLTYPITLHNLLSQLCTQCGVTLGSESITNGSFSIGRNFSASGITGRSVVSYIAEAAASFAVIGADGKLYLKRYTEFSISIDNTKYIKYTKSEYKVDKIDKVQIRVTDNDVGVVAGTGSNVWVVQNNPLLYTNESNVLNPVATTMLNAVSSFEYTPMSISLFSDSGINVGDIITVDGVKTAVMSKTMKSGGVTLTSTGGKKRDASASRVTEMLSRLNSSVAELRYDIDHFSVDLSGYYTKEETETYVGSRGYLTPTSQVIADLSANISRDKAYIDTYVSYKSLNSQIYIGNRLPAGLAAASDISAEAYARYSAIPVGTIYFCTAQHMEYIPTSAATTQATTMYAYYPYTLNSSRVWQYGAQALYGATNYGSQATSYNGRYWYPSVDCTDGEITYYANNLYLSNGTVWQWLGNANSTQVNLAQIRQEVDVQGSSISLVADSNGIKASAIIQAINGESTASISANRVFINGETIDLTTKNLKIHSDYIDIDKNGIDLTATSHSDKSRFKVSYGNYSTATTANGIDATYNASGNYRYACCLADMISIKKGTSDTNITDSTLVKSDGIETSGYVQSSRFAPLTYQDSQGNYCGDPIYIYSKNPYYVPSGQHFYALAITANSINGSGIKLELCEFTKMGGIGSTTCYINNSNIQPIASMP